MRIARSRSFSKALTWFLGAITISLALAVMSTPIGISEIINWVHEVFGITFIFLYSVLVLVALYSWLRIQEANLNSSIQRVWFEVGMHSGNGVATLGLTYTLLGISIGIADLSERELSPDTIREIIGNLTAHFSMAFLTSVVGVPTAAVLRALLSVTGLRIQSRALNI